MKLIFFAKCRTPISLFPTDAAAHVTDATALVTDAAARARVFFMGEF